MQYVSHRVVSLEEINSPLFEISSKPSVVITFDDAYENLLDNALTVLEEFQVKCSLYVVTGYVGERPGWLKGSGHIDEHYALMGREQICNIAKNPLVSIGSHTHTHPKLPLLSLSEIRAELVTSKNTLEKLLGCEIHDLAFPHGAYNRTVCNEGKSSGYTRMLTLDEQMVRVGGDRGLIGRFSMDSGVSRLEFKLTVDGAYFWLFYFRRTVRFVKRYWS
jgi:peptidoglycan/xylan/chitin deacetylase (PgdA/CDA1 family)